jgi:ribosomal-protein-alanine N-acetyltransferase
VKAVFITEHLRAEPLDRSHNSVLAPLHSDARMMATTGGVGTEEESREWVERNLAHGEEAGLGIFVFRVRSTGAFVGRGALRRIEIGGRQEVEVGYALLAERWGRGLATEMARGLVDHAESHGFRDLVAYTEPTHAASRRVMEKAGFALERHVEHYGRAQVLYRRLAGS